MRKFLECLPHVTMCLGWYRLYWETSEYSTFSESRHSKVGYTGGVSTWDVYVSSGKKMKNLIIILMSINHPWYNCVLLSKIIHTKIFQIPVLYMKWDKSRSVWRLKSEWNNGGHLYLVPLQSLIFRNPRQLEVFWELGVECSCFFLWAGQTITVKPPKNRSRM